MKALFDTSFLVAIDRKNKNAIALAQKLSEKDFELWISTITVSEIMTGAYLRPDFKNAVNNARMALAQFQWKELDGGIAVKTGELLAFQIAKGSQIEYQDTAIAATAIELKADFLVSENKKHFTIFPIIENKIMTIEEANKKIW